MLSASLDLTTGDDRLSHSLAVFAPMNIDYTQPNGQLYQTHHTPLSEQVFIWHCTDYGDIVMNIFETFLKLLEPFKFQNTAGE